MSVANTARVHKLVGEGEQMQPDSGDSWHASYLNHTRITSTWDKEGTDRETSHLLIADQALNGPCSLTQGGGRISFCHSTANLRRRSNIFLSFDL